MIDRSKVSQVRQLLQGAAAPSKSTVWQRQGPLGTIKRKGLIQEARLLAARYCLQEHLLAFVYAAGCEAITGLDIEQLDQLVAHLARMGGCLDAVCDPPGSPPAR